LNPFCFFCHFYSMLTRYYVKQIVKILNWSRKKSFEYMDNALRAFYLNSIRIVMILRCFSLLFSWWHKITVLRRCCAPLIPKREIKQSPNDPRAAKEGIKSASDGPMTSLLQMTGSCWLIPYLWRQKCHKLEILPTIWVLQAHKVLIFREGSGRLVSKWSRFEHDTLMIQLVIDDPWYKLYLQVVHIISCSHSNAT